MKKGDIVTIYDGSYSRSVINGELVHEILSKKEDRYVIIEINCKFPVLDSFQQKYETVERFNNTVIQAIDTVKVIFIEERFLKLVLPTHRVMVDMVYHHGCMLCGNTVEISDKLYQEIKRGSQD